LLRLAIKTGGFYGQMLSSTASGHKKGRLSWPEHIIQSLR
jgi:hypothetical protein